MIELNWKNTFKLPTKLYAQVEFPDHINLSGKTYYKTGKFGLSIATGVPSAEYEATDKTRVWFDANTNITPE